MQQEENSKGLIAQWLKKLEQESWQLELLVSGFTIFLLITASKEYDLFVNNLWITYSIKGNILGAVLTFLNLLKLGIISLIFFLVLHLILRGFWIGAIGLRSVQEDIDFNKLNYSTFFTQKLKEKVIGLDKLIVFLDEICSVIFSVAFLIISMIMSLGLWVIFTGFIGIIFSFFDNLTSGFFQDVIPIFVNIIGLFVFITGIIYLIDYFTLGFIKKIKPISKIYYPIYQFYGTITLSVISRSIYYYLISKYPKKRVIQIGLGLVLCILLYTSFEYDQYQYFPSGEDELSLYNHYYDDFRSSDNPVITASIKSKNVKGAFIDLFIRYNPSDNPLIRSNCPDFKPLKTEGINTKLKVVFKEKNLLITSQNYDEEDKARLKECLSTLYKVSINDSTYTTLNYYFYEHYRNKQKGLITMIPTKGLIKGENKISIFKVHHDTPDKSLKEEKLAVIPFWLE